MKLCYIVRTKEQGEEKINYHSLNPGGSGCGRSHDFACCAPLAAAGVGDPSPVPPGGDPPEPGASGELPRSPEGADGGGEGHSVEGEEGCHRGVEVLEEARHRQEAGALANVGSEDRTYVRLWTYDCPEKSDIVLRSALWT